TAGPDGNLWVTQNGGVVRFSPADPTGATAFPVPDIADPRAITTGPDGSLWTGSGDKATRSTTARTPTAATVAGMWARGITTGADDRLYLADFGSGRIVGLTTSGTPTFHPTGGGPQDVAPTADGRIAFTDPGSAPQTVGHLSGGSIP